MGNPHNSTFVSKFGTIFLIFVVVIAVFTFFKPRNPKIAVSAVQLPSFSVVNGTMNFTFCEYVSVRNPNKGTFSHYNSSLQLLYSGSQIGSMLIPAGKIEAGETQYMTVTFSVHSFPWAAPVAASEGMNGYRNSSTLEIESKMDMGGRVRVLHFFTRHVKASWSCSVTIIVSDGSVLGFHC